MIAVSCETTTGASMNSVGEFFSFSMAAFRTVLACIGRVYLYQVSTGAFSLVRKISDKLPPSYIRYIFTQTAIVNHFINRQIFYANSAILINDFSALLVGKISSFITNSFMYSR